MLSMPTLRLPTNPFATVNTTDNKFPQKFSTFFSLKSQIAANAQDNTANDRMALCFA